MTATTDLYVTTHVGRGLLHDSALFGDERAVVLEYVTNGIQYRDRGVAPVIQIQIDLRRKRIAIQDNGAGMSREALSHFFTMHGENRQRAGGKPGRGKFGTGKSAAFGIADTLRVTTVRDGQRNKVQLTRTAIRTMRSGDPVPVATIELNRKTEEPNGTLVEIEGIHLERLDLKAIEQYIEAHTVQWPDARIFLNGRRIAFAEPALAAPAREFRPTSPALRTVIGNVTLTIKVAKAPLPEHLRGIAIRANGVLLQTTLDAASGKEFANYIFGDVDIPALDDESAGVSAFDASRSMRLNRRNPVVAAALRFINPAVETVRRELVEAEAANRRRENLKHLADTAAVISKLISRDWTQHGNVSVRAQSSSLSHPAGVTVANRGRMEDDYVAVNPGTGGASASQADDLDQGIDLDAISRPASDAVRGTLDPTAVPSAPASADIPAEPAVEPVLAEQPEQKPRSNRQRRSFGVEFRGLGDREEAAAYHAELKTILINVDHPKLQAAASSARGTEDPLFLRTAYDAAFLAYAFAYTELRQKRGFYLDPADAILDLRTTLDRVHRLAADLYAPS